MNVQLQSKSNLEFGVLSNERVDLIEFAHNFRALHFRALRHSFQSRQLCLQLLHLPLAFLQLASESSLGFICGRVELESVE